MCDLVQGPGAALSQHHHSHDTNLHHTHTSTYHIHPPAMYTTNCDSNCDSISFHRPYLRSSVARSLYDRMIREEQLRKLDKSKWYRCELDQVLDQELRDRFVQLDCDEETQRFLSNCYEKSDWVFMHVFHSIARTVLSPFMTSTSINGFLNRGSMFVLSEQQLGLLWDELPLVKASQDSALLDLGAGDGKVTEIMAQSFRQTHVTEISPIMRRILAKKNYRVLDVDGWTDGPQQYDLIACLNLLDRCDKPKALLQQMLAKLKPNGRILLALVFPFSQYVECATNANHRPSEPIEIEGTTFEEQIVSLKNSLLTPNGLEIVKWSRVPYLCEGDLDLSFYWLNDAVMLLKPMNQP